MSRPLPRLRALEILHVPEETGTSYVLRDPEGYTDEELILSEPALFVAAHLDGTHTRDQLWESFASRYGRSPEEEQVQALIDRLEGAHMLETPAFFDLRERQHETFAARPTRSAQHTGLSYPKDRDEARKVVEEFYRKAEGLEEEGPRPPGALRGLVAPHIDLRVGGPVNAVAYRVLADSPRVETVFVLGTSHGCPRPAWILARKPFETPLGTVPVDEKICARLEGHASTTPAELFFHRKEHSVEFQALFLAHLRATGRDLRMVPILCGSLRGESVMPPGEPALPGEDPFLDTLAGIVSRMGERAIVVAGADLAHVGPRFGDADALSEKHLKLLEKKDRETLARVEAGDAEGFFRAVMTAGDPRRICGLSPLYALLRVLPGTRGKVLRYEQATDPTGTVTYAGLGLWA